MSGMYECDVPGCEWRNPNWRYGFAEAGANWAEHAAEHDREQRDQPCERCVFIPTPDGKCICREVDK